MDEQQSEISDGASTHPEISPTATPDISRTATEPNVGEIPNTDSIESKVEICLAGRLKYCFEAWKKITTDKFVLQCVRGYKIPFMRKPRQIFPPSPQNWTDDEVITLRAEINNLLEMKVITPCISEEGEFYQPFFLCLGQTDRKDSISI